MSSPHHTHNMAPCPGGSYCVNCLRTTATRLTSLGFICPAREIYYNSEVQNEVSDVRDPTTDQVAPIPNDGPSCHDLVMEDLTARKQFGLRKYNSLLQPNNGRSMLQDAYEEVLDLAVYLRGALEEERTKKNRV